MESGERCIGEYGLLKLTAIVGARASVNSKDVIGDDGDNNDS